MAQAFVVVVNRHGQRTLGFFLVDDVVVQVGLYFRGRRQLIALRVGCGQFFANDFIALTDALVADENGRAGDQLLHFMLAFIAKRAVEGFFAGRAFFIGHGGNALSMKTWNG